MSRHKLTEEEKKREFSISINIEINEKLEQYLETQGISNKSKYIEKLVKQDLINRGEDISENF